MYSHDIDVPVGTTTNFHVRSEEEFQTYIRENVKEVFEFGMKIQSRNIFYILLMKDTKTGQLGFSIMLGEKTVLDLHTKEKYL